MQDEHPIASENNKLNDTEQWYIVQEKKMTAIIHYLFSNKFIILMYNMATIYFDMHKKLSLR